MLFELIAACIVFAALAIEASVSGRHERALRARGGVEPAGDIYPVMRIVYPAALVAMAGEGLLTGPPPARVAIAGAVLFGAAKALKYWVVRTLGERWTFRVIVLPGAPLIAAGPYRWLRHPNYVAVVAELVGAALLFGAPIAGTAGVALFIWVLWRRVLVEERALGIRAS